MIKLNKAQVKALDQWAIKETKEYEKERDKYIYKETEEIENTDYIGVPYMCFLSDEVTLDHACRYDAVLRLADKIREVMIDESMYKEAKQ